jgi:TRAP-type C4-dicarboxylate transport system substrate-binding protein
MPIISRRTCARFGAGLIAGVLLTACGASTAGITTSKKSSTKQQPLVQAKFGSTATTQSLGGATAVYFAQQLKKDSNGRIEVTVYPNSELGGTPTINAGLQAGTIQFTANDILDAYVPAIDVLNTAYLFPSNPVAVSVLNSSAVYKLLWNKLPAEGLRVLAVWPSGFSDIFATVPIDSPSALRGIKIRTFVPAVETTEYSRVGANATAVVYDQVFTALSSHLIQAVTDPPDLVTPLQWETAAPYVSIVNMAFVTTPLLVSQSFWNSLDSIQRAEVSKAAAASLKYETAQAITYNDNSITALESESGVHVLHPNVTPFGAAFRRAYPSIEAKFPGVLQELEKLVVAAKKAK